MQLTGICIGSHCVVNNSCVRVAWPSTSLPLTGVGLQDDLMEQLGCVKGQLITVQLQEKFGSASEVELTCSDPRYNLLHHALWDQICRCNLACSYAKILRLDSLIYYKHVVGNCTADQHL